MTMTAAESRAKALAVLAVDDEPETLEEMAEMFMLEGLTVHRAGSMAEALAVLKSHAEIGTVVTDIRMPGGTGLDLLREIGQEPGQGPVRTIIVSAHADSDLVIEALRGRAVEYLVKPVQRQQLLNAVRAALVDVARERERLESSRGSLDFMSRRKRVIDRLFARSEFSETAWQMLLELSAARVSGRQMDVTGLCAGANVSRTTAWRKLKGLEAAGLVQLTPSPTDGRRILVDLSATAFAEIHELVGRNLA